MGRWRRWSPVPTRRAVSGGIAAEGRPQASARELRNMARRLGTVDYYVFPSIFLAAPGARTGTWARPCDPVRHCRNTERMRAVRARMTNPHGRGSYSARCWPSSTARRGEARALWGAHGYCMSSPCSLAGAAAMSRTHCRRRLVLWHLARQRRRRLHLSLLGRGLGRDYMACAQHNRPRH